ncbi:dihydrofolate reductase family protein [Streptomyces sp. NBC_01142]|uniref:dihydrofolate reductase family protein n=1 Tax=Streptomyces sp. NBC_01142 TaxID=2975865 RepID=UPI00225042C0|nr:dihydrofolate reductase family protein [Streptomyces sp. NBC_01142]MCX4819894.1 dihydrofolate reductase family protein [Streptomyces sp. NBC_01142]
MRKLTYYIAATLDGYIAGPDGQYGFLPFEGEEAAAILAEFPETMPTPARQPYGVADRAPERFDTVIMGRGTYDPGFKAGLTSPYAHLKQYVVSRTLTSPDPAITVVDDNPAALVRELKKQDGMGIWLCGGGKLAAALRDEIDELIIKRHPITIGSGIPLFDGPFTPTNFAPVATRSFDSGLTITTFSKALSSKDGRN